MRLEIIKRTTSSSLLLGALALSCAGQAKNARIGITDESEPDGETKVDLSAAADEVPDDVPQEPALDSDAASDGTSDVPPDGADDRYAYEDAQIFDEESAEEGAFEQDAHEDLDERLVELMDAELLRSDVRDQELARLALEQSKGQPNPWGLEFAVSQRTSDLPWILAVKNPSDHTISLAALPSLVRFTVTPPEAEGSEETSSTTCGGDRPKKVAENERIELNPGQLLYYSFDPRRLCAEESTLRAGSKVTVFMGFDTQTKKKWQGGRVVEVEAEQTAPFLATLPSGSEKKTSGSGETSGLKHLIADPFVLGKTYPLGSVSLAPEDQQAAPPPLLRLTIEDLGTLRHPLTGTVTVTVRNVSQQTFPLFLRRELITYEVVGRWSSVTCQLYPDDRAPDPAAFATLSPGESRTLTTRLAEACPKEAFKYPGTYAVSARLDATETGRAFGMNAFTGTVTTDTPGRLELPGKRARRPMRLANE